jgi:gluconolactonase
MKMKWCMTAMASLGTLLAQQKGGPKQFAQPGPPIEVTVKAIPGVVADGAKVTPVWQGEATADGMAATPDGGIMSAQEQTNRVNKLDKNNKFSVLYDTPHGPGAVAVGPKNHILTVERTCTDPGGHLGVQPQDCKEATDVAELTPTRKVLVDNIDGKGLGRVNDIIADKKGGAYFTSGSVFYMKPDHKVINIGQNIRPNGIMLSRDEKILYVTNGATLVALDIQPDGSTTNQRDFAKLEAGGVGDGMAIDSTGRLYVTSAPGVQVFSPEGKYLGVIPMPRNPITLTFSGPNKKTLYVGCMGMLTPDGKNFATAPGVRNVAMTIYTVPMMAQGFKGRAK